MMEEKNVEYIVTCLRDLVQSWGIDSKFEVRRTENAPSKSGVTGLLAAALGIQRNEDISSLNQLRLGVRTDQEGRLLKDFHTAHSEKNSYITTRYYLSDAIFCWIRVRIKDFCRNWNML